MKNKTYSIGAKFNNGEYNYILAQVLPYQVTLICLLDGNRYSDPLIRVEDPWKISEKDMNKVCGGDFDNFTEGWI